MLVWMLKIPKRRGLPIAHKATHETPRHDKTKTTAIQDTAMQYNTVQDAKRQFITIVRKTYSASQREPLPDRSWEDNKIHYKKCSTEKHIRRQETSTKEPRIQDNTVQSNTRH